MSGVEEVAAELYGLPLEEFTAARDERAKAIRADGDRTLAAEVRALRRPSTAAWAVNVFVRAQPDEVEQLLTVGAALREAQEAADGEELRRLNRQQHAVLAAVRRQARGVALDHGHRLSEAVGRQVEATLRAAMADPDAAAAVRSGLLLRDLESTGFDPVDLEGAVAVPGAVPAPSAPSPRRPASPARPTPPPARDDRAAEEDHAAAQAQEAARRAAEEEARRREAELRAAALREAESAAAEAEDAARAATDALTDAERQVEDAGRRRAEAVERLEALREELERAEQEEDEATRHHREVRSARDVAARAADQAGRAAERARARLARLRED